MCQEIKLNTTWWVIHDVKKTLLQMYLWATADTEESSERASVSNASEPSWRSVDWPWTKNDTLQMTQFSGTNWQTHPPHMHKQWNRIDPKDTPPQTEKTGQASLFTSNSRTTAPNAGFFLRCSSSRATFLSNSRMYVEYIFRYGPFFRKMSASWAFSSLSTEQ